MSNSKTFNSKKYGVITVTWKSDGRTMTKYTVNKVITDEEASDIQLELGYHPCGYGKYGFKTTSTTSSWSRGNSCD